MSPQTCTVRIRTRLTENSYITPQKKNTCNYQNTVNLTHPENLSAFYDPDASLQSLQLLQKQEMHANRLMCQYMHDDPSTI